METHSLYHKCDVRRVVVLSTQFQDRSLFDLSFQLSEHINNRDGWMCYNPNEFKKLDCLNPSCNGECTHELRRWSACRLMPCIPCPVMMNRHGNYKRWCWKKSFRFHLTRAASSGGFMLQIRAVGKNLIMWDTECQIVEETIANAVGCKIDKYRQYAPLGSNEFRADQIDLLLDFYSGKDVVEYQMHHLKHGTHKEKICACQLITGLCYNQEVKLMVGDRLDGLDSIVDVMSTDRDGAEAGTYLLGWVCSFCPPNQDRAGAHAHVMGAVVQMLLHNDSLVKIAAAHTLAMIVRKHAANQERVRKMEQVIDMLSALSCSDDEGCKTAASRALDFLYDGPASSSINP